MMEHVTRFILGMVFVLCIVLTAAPVSAADTGNCTRSYNMVLVISPAGVTEQAVQIVYGSSIHPADAPGDLRGKVLSGEGRTLQEFPLWDPRIQFGEDITVDENGNVTRTNGIQKRETRATLAVMFPADPEARSFAVYDNTGKVMKTIDLTKAENKATWNCTPDYGIPLRNYPSTGTPGIPWVTITVLAGLLAAGGAGYYILKKRSDRKTS
jgi:hypothetical protein